MEGWDPFSDDLVNRKAAPSAKPVEPVEPDDGAPAIPDAPVAVPNPARAARAEADPMARPVPTRAAPVIVVEELKSMEPPTRPAQYGGPPPPHVPYGGIPARPAALPEEMLVRPPARLAVPPPVSEDDLYAVRETPAPESPASRKPDRPEPEPEKRPVTATSAATRSRPSPVRRPASVTGANPAAESASTATPMAVDRNAEPAWRGPQTIPDRQLAEYEERARRKLDEAEQRARDASITTRQFFGQRAVLGRIGILSVLGITLGIARAISVDGGAAGMLQTLVIALLFGGVALVLLVLFVTYLLQTLVETFDLAFNNSLRLDEWPLTVPEMGLIDRVLLVRYPLFAGTMTGFLVAGFQVMLLTISLIPGVGLLLPPETVLNIGAYVVVPACFLLWFPLSYMTALANNDMFDLLPLVVWRTRRLIGRRLGRFYLEQLGLVAAFFGCGFAVGRLKDVSEILFHILSIVVMPPVCVFLMMLLHERLGRLAAACVVAEHELEPKRKKKKKSPDFREPDA